MKERWNGFTVVQKWTMLIAALLAVVFGVIYAVRASRQGIICVDSFLVFSQEGEERRYAGESEWAEVTFTANGDTVTSLWGGESHTYTVTKDPSALPAEESRFGQMLGVEVREGDTVLFRGGWDPDYGIRVNENGETESFLSVRTNFDPPMREPDMGLVLELWHGPEMISQVRPGFYAMGLMVALLGAAELFFAEDLFRWRLSWRVRDPERAEPSEWELFSRTFGAIVITGLALICWLSGLNPAL